MKATIDLDELAARLHESKPDGGVWTEGYHVWNSTVNQVFALLSLSAGEGSRWNDIVDNGKPKPTIGQEVSEIKRMCHEMSDSALRSANIGLIWEAADRIQKLSEAKRD